MKKNLSIIKKKNFNFFLKKNLHTKNIDFDIGIIGGGIIGLSTGRELLKRNKNLKIAIFEKESILANHQSKHNSGVIHSGIYYLPGSLKAKLCVEGAKLMYNYCEKNNIPFKNVVKIS